MKKILIYLINVYKKYFALVLIYVFGKGCRFQPSCSQYAKEALGKYGVLKGGLMSIKRLLKCHPFGSAGYDPVPVYS
ncbi:MAG: membrane protein insertion efficiency factor YidD [bacterium]|nr:membrane protein insertion efficiency factor YidD [bacterium]